MTTMSRRRVAWYTTVAGIAGPTILSSSCATEAPAAQRKMTVSLSCGSIGVKATQAQAIDFAHRYGFEAVAVNANELARLSDADLQEMLADLKTKGLVLGAASMPGDFRVSDEKFAATMEKMPGFAKTLERAGVTRVRKFIAPGSDELPYSDNFKLHSRRIGEVAAVLGDHGLRLGLEYVGPKTSRTQQYPFVHTLKQTLELIADAGKDNVGIVADSWHWYTAGETEADLLSLTNKDVVAVDINDAPAGIPVDEQDDHRRALPMATGVIAMGTFLNALNSIGYDGPVRIEPFSEELRQMPAEEAVAATAEAMKKAFALIR